MKEVKIVEVAQVELKLTKHTDQPIVLTLNGNPMSLEEVTELVDWLRKEVLNETPVTNTVSLSPITSNKDTPSVQTFQPIQMEDRVVRKDLVVYNSNQGGIDLLSDRRVNPEERSKYRQVTDPTQLGGVSGVDLRGGLVDKPFTVKL